MKKILIILIIFNLNFGNVYAIQPDVFVQSTVNRPKVLSKNLTKDEKINQIDL